jgi:hypothetical protein
MEGSIPFRHHRKTSAEGSSPAKERRTRRAQSMGYPRRNDAIDVNDMIVLPSRLSRRLRRFPRGIPVFELMLPDLPAKGRAQNTALPPDT